MRDAAVRVEDVGRVETARAIRARIDEIRATWQQLIGEQVRNGDDLPTFILDASLTALADYIESPDPTIAAGFGLVAIRERIRLLHGTFSVESNREDGAGGAILQVRVPFEPHRDARAERTSRAYHAGEGIARGAINTIGAAGAGVEAS